MEKISMNILVTGGLGFIGSHLVDALIEDGHTVKVVDDLSTGLIENWNPKSIAYKLDVVDYCKEYNEKFDLIFHLANNARIERSFEYPQETLSNNFNSTLAICEYVRKTNSGHLFFASSSTTDFTDRLNNPYTFSKAVCDELLELYKQIYGVNYSIVKFYNVYGSMREKDLGHYTTIIRKFKQLYLEKKPLTIIGDGTRRRDFTSIEDTINALIVLSKLENHEVLYGVGTGKSYSIYEIAKAFNHPVEYIEDRKYELRETLLTYTSIPGWKPKHNVIEHIKNWKENL
jgi:UDP-glucose 4-epimerase